MRFSRLFQLAQLGVLVVPLCLFSVVPKATAYTLAGPGPGIEGTGVWDWSGGSAMAEFRNRIEDPANFGPAGIVPTSVETLDLTTFTSSSLAGADGFISPYWKDSNKPSTAVDAIVGFFLGGGDLFLLGEDENYDDIAATLGIRILDTAKKGEERLLRAVALPLFLREAGCRQGRSPRKIGHRALGSIVSASG